MGQCLGIKKQTGPLFDDFYDMHTEEPLGKGAYAIVYRCFRKSDGKELAVKICDRTKLSGEDEEALQDEISILKGLDHSNIVRLFDVFEEMDKYYLVMEFCDGGELFDRIVLKKKYNEKEARDLIRILLEAIKYIHDNNVVHRDLKPENLLLESKEDDANVKIADFGFAQRLEANQLLKDQCGTPGYVAPEILRMKLYDSKVDMWSIGVISYIILSGYPPFYSEDQKKLFRKIKNGDFVFHSPHWDGVSDDAKNYISSLLTVDPFKRLSANDALNHQWVCTSDEVLMNRDLSGAVTEMKKFNAKRKFRAGVRAIVMMNRMNNLKNALLSAEKSSEGEDDSPHDGSPSEENEA